MALRFGISLVEFSQLDQPVCSGLAALLPVTQSFPPPTSTPSRILWQDASEVKNAKDGRPDTKIILVECRIRILLFYLQPLTSGTAASFLNTRERGF